MADLATRAPSGIARPGGEVIISSTTTPHFPRSDNAVTPHSSLLGDLTRGSEMAVRLLALHDAPDVLVGIAATFMALLQTAEQVPVRLSPKKLQRATERATGNLTDAVTHATLREHDLQTRLIPAAQARIEQSLVLRERVAQRVRRHTDSGDVKVIERQGQRFIIVKATRPEEQTIIEHDVAALADLTRKTQVDPAALFFGITSRSAGFVSHAEIMAERAVVPARLIEQSRQNGKNKAQAAILINRSILSE